MKRSKRGGGTTSKIYSTVKARKEGEKPHSINSKKVEELFSSLAPRYPLFPSV